MARKWTVTEIEWAYDEGRLIEDRALELLQEIYDAENQEGATLEESTD